MFSNLAPKLSLLTLTLIHIQISQAETVDNYSYNSRITGQFLAGGAQQFGGFGDAMFPFLRRTDKIVFADSTVLLGQEQRAAYSGGLGYRGLQNIGSYQGIFGAYVFGELYKTQYQNNYWQLNPGLEWLSVDSEVRIQGYVPLSSRSQVYQNTLASNIPQNVIEDSGNHANNLTIATGHTLMDTPVALIEQFGPGVELEGGRLFNYGRGVWVRLGGYYFNYQNAASIPGIEANIEMILTRNVSLLLQNNYDDQNKNRFSVGLRINLGGSDAPAQTLQSRMTAPIIRHIARQSYGEALPSRLTFKPTGPQFTATDNIWYFSPSGTAPEGLATNLNNCTAENPCSTIDTPTATRIDQLTPGAKFFFESGNYVIPLDGARIVFLQDEQSFWGRTTNWLSPAQGNDRPLIAGGLFWGNQNDGVNPILADGEINNMRIVNNNQILPQSAFNYAVGGAVIGAGASRTLTVRNSDILARASQNNTSGLGIAARNAIVDNSQISGISLGNATITGVNGVFTNGIGIHADQSVNVSNSIVGGTTEGNASGGGIANATGVNAGNTITDTGTVSILRSSITANAAGEVTGNGSQASAFGVRGLTDVNISDSQISAAATGNVTGGQAIAFGVDGGSNVGSLIAASVTITNSLISANTSGNSDGLGIFSNGAFAQGVRSTSEITISNSQIITNTLGNTTNSASNDAVGVRSFGNATIVNSSITVSTAGSADGAGSTSSALGTRIQNSVTIIDSAINIDSNGIASNDGFTQSTGVFSAGNTTLTNTTVEANSNGDATTNGNSSAVGVFSLNTLTIRQGSQISAESRGNATGGGNAGTIGAVSFSNATVDDSSISALSAGDSSTTGTNQSTGLSAQNATLQNSTVDARTSGADLGGGNVDAIGIIAATTTFTGTSSSFITAISENGTATAIDSAVVNNNSTPPSQCSTDGVTYTDCP
jgi:hypothetical protein